PAHTLTPPSSPTRRSSDLRRIRVVDHRHRQAAQAGAEQRCRVRVDPALVDVRRRTDGGSAGDHTGKGEADRAGPAEVLDDLLHADRKSTRLNSSHEWISYA